MATNREVKQRLLKQLGVTPQRLSQRVAQVKRLYGPMSTEDGTYVLAHQFGIDLTKYLRPDAVDRVRGLVPKGALTAPAKAAVPSSKRATSPKTSPIRIGPSLQQVDALLPKNVTEEAQRMANIYPKLYVFENSVRNVIIRVLRARHGRDWWLNVAPAKLQSTVKSRKAAEKKMPWHGTRGTHEIYYSNFSDLRQLISDNWSDFAGIFPKESWITQRLEELEPPRNVVAHHNPLKKHDENRIDLYFNDWIALINDRKDVIP